MTKKLKHQVVVEVTYDEPVNERMAAGGVFATLQRVDLDLAPVWQGSDIYIDSFKVKQYSHVIASEKVKFTKSQLSHITFWDRLKYAFGF